jgi:F-type H+-transporting ATPase subunit delta
MSGAKDYAEALFSLAEELSITERVLADTEVCCAVFEKNPTYASLADTPAMGISEKLSLIDEAFSSVDENVKNLIKILSERHSVHEFVKIAKELRKIYDEDRGIMRAEVISARPISARQLDTLKQKLGALTGKTVVLKSTIDTSILGGIKLRYMGKQLDASLRSRLDAIERGLKDTVL